MSDKNEELIKTTYSPWVEFFTMVMELSARMDAAEKAANDESQKKEENDKE